MENIGIHDCNTNFGMTNEQIETLRKQIAVYAYISELLIHSHKHSSSHQHLTSGAEMRMTYDSRLLDKLNSKQRWSPTAPQIQALEQIYAANPKSPNKETVKKIATELSKYGTISESNVYNWFQNRRARSKKNKKKHNNVDEKLKAQIKVDSKDKMIEPNELVESKPAENLGQQNSQVCSDFLPYFNPYLDDSFAIL